MVIRKRYCNKKNKIAVQNGVNSAFDSANFLRWSCPS